MTNAKISLLTIPFAFLLLTQSSYPQPITLTPLVLQGQPAPGTGGGKFLAFGQVSLNDAGDVVFNAGVTGGNTKGGVFLVSGGRIQPVLLAGAPPNIADGVFTGSRTPLINNRGDVIFIGVIDEGRQNLILVFSGGKLSRLVASGEVLKDPRVGISSITRLSLNDSEPRAVAFSATTFLATTGSTEAIFLSSGGQLSLAAAPGATTGANALGAPSINDLGAIAFEVQSRVGPPNMVASTGIALLSQGKVTRIVSRGDPAPGTGGGIFASEFPPDITNPSLNNSGKIAFFSTVGGGTTSRGLFLFSDGLFSPVALEGQLAPESSGRKFPNFSAPVLNNRGSVAFSAGFGTTVFDLGTFLFDGGKLLKIASVGDPAPGSSGGKFLNFGAPALNDFNDVAFTAAITGGNTSQGIFVASPGPRLHFAQFADGSQTNTSISSQITLVNLNSDQPARATVEINDDVGNPLAVDLNGDLVIGKMELVIPAAGSVSLKTDGKGPLQSGSVTARADTNISGFILYNASVGVAGVGASQPLRSFVAPIETAPGVNSGVALMGLGQDQTIQLELRDPQGNQLATATVPLGARAHLARFVSEFGWNPTRDFASFSGTLVATGSAEFAATVIRASPGEFATLPVAEKK